MKALLYKDYASSKYSYLISGAVLIIFIGLAIFGGKLMYIPFTFAFIPVMINTWSIGVEEQAGFTKFIFITPVSKKTYVLSKYIFPVILSLLAFVLGTIIFNYELKNLGVSVVIGSLLFLIPIIISAFQVPVYLKYELNKGKIFTFVIYVVLFSSINSISKYLDKIIEFINKIISLNPYMLAGGIILVAIIILSISIKVGEKIIENKEH